MPVKKKLVYNPTETRRTLLEATVEEMWIHGYQMASLTNILARAGVTKGALYHHFKNKHELGIAALEELLGPQIHETWTKGLEEADDPIDALRAIAVSRIESKDMLALKYGCPLNNLAAEMSPLDEEFRVRISTIFAAWRGAIAAALEAGQDKGLVAEDVVPARAAHFIVAVMEGAICAAKVEQNHDVLQACLSEFDRYTKTLRPCLAHQAL